MRRSDSRSNRVGEREVRSATLPTNFLYHLLTLASRPATNLDRLVCHLLERALVLTRSNVGGGLFVFELVAQEPKLVASALRGVLADTPADLVKKWKQNPRSAIELVIQSGRWYSSDDHRHDPTHFPLLAGSRSSLWVPLLDGAQVMGILYVESSRPRYYREAHRRQLETLAADAVLAIRRLLFREEMRRSELQVDMIGASSAFLELEWQTRLIASTDAPVLITGERGSGKEVAARAIHFWSAGGTSHSCRCSSPRFQRAWWPMNCSDMSGMPSQARPANGQANSKRLKAVRSSWTKSLIPLGQFRQHCCG